MTLIVGVGVVVVGLGVVVVVVVEVVVVVTVEEDTAAVVEFSVLLPGTDDGVVSMSTDDVVTELSVVLSVTVDGVVSMTDVVVVVSDVEGSGVVDVTGTEGLGFWVVTVLLTADTTLEMLVVTVSEVETSTELLCNTVETGRELEAGDGIILELSIERLVTAAVTI